MLNRKIIYTLLATIIIFSVIFILQIRKTSGITVRQSDAPLISSQPEFIPLDPTDPALGNPGAEISLVEFGSIGCRECARVNDQLYKFVQANPDRAQLVWKDAPTTGILFGGNLLAHQGSYCAGRQGQFWRFLNLAMAGDDWTSENGLKKIAAGLELNLNSWAECLNSPDSKEKMATAIELTKSLNIHSAPALFINNKKINLAAKVNLEELLEKLLK